MSGQKRAQHLIADIRQRAGDCWTRCQCGHRVEGPTPEDTAEQFGAHRRAQGLKNTGTPRSAGRPSVFRVKPRVGSRTAAEDYRTW